MYLFHQNVLSLVLDSLPQVGAGKFVPASKRAVCRVMLQQLCARCEVFVVATKDTVLCAQFFRVFVRVCESQDCVLSTDRASVFI